jgi:hypothetical protein
MTELEQLREENKKLREQLAERDARIALLEQKIDLLIRQIYGTKSEKLDPAQLDLLFGDGLGKAESSAGDSAPAAEESGAESAEGEPPRRKSKSRRPRIPEHLPVVEEVIDPDCVKACPEAWRCIGEEVRDAVQARHQLCLPRPQPSRSGCRKAQPTRHPRTRSAARMGWLHPAHERLTRWHFTAARQHHERLWRWHGQRLQP